MIECNIKPVIEAIIDCLGLPISKKCETVLIERTSLTFITDTYDEYKQQCTIQDVSFHIEMPWHGTYLCFTRKGDIGHFEINLKTYKTRYTCCYNAVGRIKYGRYYEPQMD